MIYAPIVLFTYNRLKHTQQTVEALRHNELAQASELFVFSDGPTTETEHANVSAVREYLRTITGFKSVNIIKRETNLGLAQSIITGVTDIVNKYDRIIVLEDDLVTSPWFLRYMNEALELYRDEERVISIHGYVYPVKTELPHIFFLKGADCWGWATWKRGWDLFESDGQKLLNELSLRKLTHRFDFDSSHGYTSMLEGQVSGMNDSWAVRWYASAFLRDKFTLYPGRSLIHNTGNDESGTNCGASDNFDTDVSREPIRLDKIPIEEYRGARESFKEFFRSLQPSFYQRAMGKIIHMMDGKP